MSARDLVNAIIAGEALEIENAFNSAMSEKLSVAMDAMREHIACNMFNEEVEQLDELSKKTLVSYIKRATRNAITTHASARDTSRRADDREGDEARALRADARRDMEHSQRRQRGIVQAANKLTKEESELNLEDFSLEEIQDFMMSEDFEQLDELSKTTLGKYMRKANVAATEHRRRAQSDARHQDDMRAVSHFWSGKKEIDDPLRKATANAIDYLEKSKQKNIAKADKRERGIETAVKKLTKEESELDESIKVSDSSVKHYEKDTGLKARGVKHWMFSKTHPSEFNIDKHGYTMQHGTYSDAKKKAIKVYKDAGHVGEIHLLG